MRLARFAVLGLCGAIWAGLTAAASAQVVGGFPPGTYPGLQYSPYGSFMPHSGFGSGMNGLTPQQFSTMMGMRMLQGMGGYHGVQTGVPNPIINGGGFGGQPQLYNEGPATSTGSGTSNSGTQSKRAAARAERAEEKRLAAAAKAKTKADKVGKQTRKPKDPQ